MGTASRSSSPGCKREPTRCRVRGYLRMAFMGSNLTPDPFLEKERGASSLPPLSPWGRGSERSERGGVCEETRIPRERFMSPHGVVDYPPERAIIISRY